MATALFVCLHNAGRSQISAALFERAAGGRHRVMAEMGIDLRDRTPRLLSRALAGEADVVVTMGCGDACPYIPGRRYVDWELPDPKGRPLDEVRAIRDDIARRAVAPAADLDG